MKQQCLFRIEFCLAVFWGVLVSLITQIDFAAEAAKLK